MSIKFFKVAFFAIILCFSTMIPQQITIMLDPAGDAQSAGREIQDSFERGLTLQFVQELKNEIIQHYPNVRVILTRTPGETIQPMHNALFANRLQPDLYLRIGFYFQPEIPTHVTLFYACNHPNDFWQKINSLQFFHIDQSHLLHLPTTKKLAHDFLKILQNHLGLNLDLFFDNKKISYL